MLTWHSGSVRGAAVARCCLLMLLLTALPDFASCSNRQIGRLDPVAGTCGKSLNIGLDYFLRTKLFASLSKVDLPTKIPLPSPLSAVKIVNLQITGLESVSRSCSLDLSVVDESRLRLRACAHLPKINASFVLNATKHVDTMQATVTDTSISAQAIIHMVPGGLIQLESFDVTLGDIRVKTVGITGAIIARLLKMDSTKEKLRAAIVAQGGKKIQEELKKHPLPK